MLQFPAGSLLRSKKLVLLFAYLLTLPLALMIPLRPDHWDGSIFAYVGQQWVNGVIPYTGAFENKPPAIFLLNALGAYFHHPLGVVGVAYFAATVAGSLVIGAILASAGAAPEIAGVGTLLAALLMNSGGYYAGNMPESFMFYPAAASMLVFFRSIPPSGMWRVLLAGLLAGLACLFKPFALTVLGAQILFIVVRWRLSYARKLLSILILLAGAVLAWMPFVIYFHLHNSLWPMLNASFFYNVHEAVAALRMLHNSVQLLKYLFHVAPALIAVCLAVFFFPRSGFLNDPLRSDLWLLSLWWLLMGLALILSVGHGYPQYVLSVLPAAAICLTMFLWMVAEISPHRILIDSVVALSLIPLLVPYLVTFEPLGDTTSDAAAASKIIQMHRPADTLLVWGSEAWIPFATGLRSASRFFCTLYIYDSPWAYHAIGSEVLNTFATHPPTWVAVELDFVDNPARSQAALADPADDAVKEQFLTDLRQSYVKVWSDSETELYRHK